MTTTIRTLALAMLALALAAPSRGAEIVLRDRVLVAGPIVRLGDIAEIAADNAADLDGLTAAPLMPAPAAGGQEFLTALQLVDLLAACGFAPETLTIRGADAVAISTSSTAGVGSEASSIETSTGPLPTEVRSGVVTRAAAAIEAFLRQQTAHSTWQIAVEPTPELVAALAVTDSQLTAAGGRAPWTGMQRFDVSTTGAGRIAVAHARVARITMLAFAVRPIARGDLVRAVDVEIRPYAGDVPDRAVQALEDLIGREALQPIRAETMIFGNQVRLPLLVHRGERVEVTARAAGIAVRTFATASEEGSRGDLVMVESLTDRQRYAARVVGPQQLEVFAASPSAEELSRSRR